MPRLADGIYAPRHFGLASSGARQQVANTVVNRNEALRVGYTVGIHFPGDPGYTDITEVVYDVASPVSTQGGGWNWQMYPNVRVGMGLGGSSNDFSRIRLQTPKNWKQGDLIDDRVLRESSAVLFECANGISSYAHIVGFATHPFNKDTDGIGQIYRFNYNGVQTLINAEGEYSVTFVGNILDPGTNLYQDIPENTTGTFIKLDKLGTFIADNVAGESIRLDKSNKELSIIGRAVNIQASQGDLTTDSTGKTNMFAQGNAVFNSGKKVYIGKEGATDPGVLGNKLVDSLGVLVDDFLNAPLIGQAGPFPCLLHPVLRVMLLTWKSLYAQRNTSPFLSRKVFVE